MKAKKCQEAIQRQQRDMNNLRIQHQSTEDRITELQDEMANDELRAGRLTQLKENLQNNKEEHESYTRSLIDGVAAFEEYRGIAQDLKGEKQEKDREREELDRQLRDREARVSKLKQKIDSVGKSISALVQKLDELRVQKSAKEAKLDKRRRTLREVEVKAAEKSARVPVPEGETPVSLKDKILKLKADYAEAIQR